MMAGNIWSKYPYGNRHEKNIHSPVCKRFCKLSFACNYFPIYPGHGTVFLFPNRFFRRSISRSKKFCVVVRGSCVHPYIVDKFRYFSVHTSILRGTSPINRENIFHFTLSFILFFGVRIFLLICDVSNRLRCIAMGLADLARA